MRFLIYDYGNFLYQSVGLAHAGHEVFYFSHWQEAFPRYQTYLVGSGLEDEGVKKVLEFWKYIDDVDYIINWDVYGQDVIEHLRSLNYACWGAGKLSILENNRILGKEVLKKLGLPVMNYEVIKGLENLKKYLQKHKNKVVKIDIFRGDIDTFKATTYEEVELKLETLIPQCLGPWRDDINFIVEDDVATEESVEIGSDVIFSGEDFLRPYCMGYEIAKSFYIGRFIDKLPPVLQNTLDRLKPLFQKYNYQGAFSTEEIVVSPRRSYLIDFCCRLASPLSAAYPLVIKNWSDVVISVCEKTTIEIEPIAEYWGILPLESYEAKERFLYLGIPEHQPTWGRIIPYIYLKRNNKYYSCPPSQIVLVLVSWGDSVKEVANNLKRLLDMDIKVEGLDTYVLGYLDEAIEECRKGAKFGIEFKI